VANSKEPQQVNKNFIRAVWYSVRGYVHGCTNANQNRTCSPDGKPPSSHQPTGAAVLADRTKECNAQRRLTDIPIHRQRIASNNIPCPNLMRNVCKCVKVCVGEGSGMCSVCAAHTRGGVAAVKVPPAGWGSGAQGVGAGRYGCVKVWEGGQGECPMGSNPDR